MLATLHERIRRNLIDLGQEPAAVERVSGHADLAAAVADAAFVFEAGPENLALKQQIFAPDRSRRVPPKAILASNTSVIPITQIMSCCAQSRAARSARTGGTPRTSCRWSK